MGKGRSRDPARDEAFFLWKAAGGKKAPRGTLKEISEKLDKSVSLIRKWKSEEGWNSNGNGNVTKDKSNGTNRRGKIKKAKSLVENGATLKEAAEITGISSSTLGNYSSKEGWTDTRILILTTFEEEQAERIRINKLKRLSLNDRILEPINQEIEKAVNKGVVSKVTLEKLLLNEQTEQTIIEKDRIDRIIKQAEDTTLKTIEAERKHQELKDVTPVEQDDGFLEALGITTKEDWEDYE